MALDIPVTLVPLDATNDVATPADIVAVLDADHAAAGADIAFETTSAARTSPRLATTGGTRRRPWRSRTRVS
jgi:inosine-uridine nucleoside N-ribohydrolase